LRKGKVDEAIVQYKKALEINPAFAEVHNNLGAAFFQNGQFADAIIQFQEVVKINPGSIEAQNTLSKAEALVRQKAPH